MSRLLALRCLRLSLTRPISSPNVIRPTFIPALQPRRASLSSNLEQNRSFASRKSNKKGKKGVAASDVESEAITSELSFNEEASEAKMRDSVQRLKNDLAMMRIGRANPALLDVVRVDLGEYGHMPLKDIAQVTIRDPNTLLVHVNDPEFLTAVDRSIRNANLNLNPILENKAIKVPVPKATKELREKLVKSVGEAAEQTRIRVRQIRQNAMKDLKKDLKNGLSEDEHRRFEKKVQGLTDKYIKSIEEVLTAKIREIQA
ncbi:uncharacterized protein VTP21DRAFT_150 [Calcarisporiella thermophila]|uniref:uncharacterized protein n=1 Tax=Calcarisporiella thermophila TaxID=911321 RepID=UPI0037428607